MSPGEKDGGNSSRNSFWETPPPLRFEGRSLASRKVSVCHSSKNLTQRLWFFWQIRLVNIRADEIVDGNPKLTLGLIWTVILHFQVRHSLLFLFECSFASWSQCTDRCGPTSTAAVHCPYCGTLSNVGSLDDWRGEKVTSSEKGRKLTLVLICVNVIEMFPIDWFSRDLPKLARFQRLGAIQQNRSKFPISQRNPGICRFALNTDVKLVSMNFDDGYWPTFCRLQWYFVFFLVCCFSAKYRLKKYFFQLFIVICIVCLLWRWTSPENLEFACSDRLLWLFSLENVGNFCSIVLCSARPRKGDR